MRILLTYDIIDDRQRTLLAKTLTDFGKRVQYSVFECDLSADQVKTMKKRAMKFIDQEKDSFRIYYLCNECIKKLESIGVKKGYEDTPTVGII